MKPNMFINEGSTVMINMDFVEMVRVSEPTATRDAFLDVFFRSGQRESLSLGNVKQFIAAWKRYCECGVGD
jgi:hypothetical protein